MFMALTARSSETAMLLCSAPLRLRCACRKHIAKRSRGEYERRRGAAKLAKKQQQHQAEYQGSVVETETEEGREKQRYWQRQRQWQRLREPQRQEELSSFYFIVGKLRVVVAVVVVVGNVAFAFAFGFASPLKCLND